jgi:hypothetical protein
MRGRWSSPRLLRPFGAGRLIVVFAAGRGADGHPFALRTMQAQDLDGLVVCGSAINLDLPKCR